MRRDTDGRPHGSCPGDPPPPARCRAILAAACSTLLVIGCAPRASPMLANSYLGQTPPELPAGGSWINSDGPLQLDDLRGKVVWLEFGFLG